MKFKVVIFLFFVIFSFIFTDLYYKSKYEKILEEEDGNKYKIKLKYLINQDSGFIESFWERFNEKYYKKDTNRNIIILGCSYAEGAGIELNKNLSAQLSEYISTSVLNLAFGGHGIHSAYKFFSIPENNKLLKDKIPTVDYFIYVYMEDHLRRLYEPSNIFAGKILPQYHVKNNSLIEKNYNYFTKLLYSSYLLYELRNREMHKNYENEKENYQIFNAVIMNLNNKIKELFPSSKFIILNVPVKQALKQAKDSTFPEWETNKLNEMGITVINATELTNKDIKNRIYYQEDDCHPTVEYWEAIVPELSKKLVFK